MKLCGFNEKCFVNGENEFGHLGFNMCKYLNERKSGNRVISFCGKDSKQIRYYDSYNSHLEAIRLEFNERMLELKDKKFNADDFHSYICNILKDIFSIENRRYDEKN